MQPDEQHIHHHVHYIPVKPKPVYGVGTWIILGLFGTPVVLCLFTMLIMMVVNLFK